jgi:hypothetical protein
VGVCHHKSCVKYPRIFEKSVGITKQILKILKKSEQILGLSNKGHVGRTRRIRNEYKVLVIKPEGKRSRGRLRPRSDVTVKFDLKAMGWEVVGSG